MESQFHEMFLFWTIYVYIPFLSDMMVSCLMTMRKWYSMLRLIVVSEYITFHTMKPYIAGCNKEINCRDDNLINEIKLCARTYLHRNLKQDDRFVQIHTMIKRIA